MKPNRYMLMLAVLLLASGGNGLRAGDSAGDKAVTASFTDTSDVSDYYSNQDDQSADVAPQPADAKAEPAETPEAPAAVSRTDYNTPIWMNNPSIGLGTATRQQLAGHTLWLVGSCARMARRPWSVSGRVWKSPRRSLTSTA